MTDATGGGGLAGDQSRRAKREEGKTYKLLDPGPQEGKLLDVAIEIYGNPPRGDDMAFTHAVFCQVGLPRSRVEGREFMRQSGEAWVSVQAGYLDEGQRTGPATHPLRGVATAGYSTPVDPCGAAKNAGDPHRGQRCAVP